MLVLVYTGLRCFLASGHRRSYCMPPGLEKGTKETDLEAINNATTMAIKEAITEGASKGNWLGCVNRH